MGELYSIVPLNISRDYRPRKEGNMPEEVCSICKRHLRYINPIEDKTKIPSMCPKCEREQDQFLADIKEAEQRVKEYRKGINEPPGYNKENK